MREDSIDPKERGRGRRAVLDSARRKVERALAQTDAADALADAAEAVLKAAAAAHTAADRLDLDALRTALVRYRRT